MYREPLANALSCRWTQHELRGISAEPARIPRPQTPWSRWSDIFPVSRLNMDPVRIPPPNMLQAAGTPDVRSVGPIRIPSDPVRILRKKWHKENYSFGICARHGSRRIPSGSRNQDAPDIRKTILSANGYIADPIGSRQDPSEKMALA